LVIKANVHKLNTNPTGTIITPIDPIKVSDKKYTKRSPYDPILNINQIEGFGELSEHMFAWYGFRHQDVNKACKHANDDDKRNCKRCMGSGFLFTDYLVKAYISLSSPGVEYIASVGKLSTSTKYAYISSAYEIAKGDYLIELELDRKTGIPIQPFTIREKYVIGASPMPIRGKNGRLVYWKCFIEERISFI
jgi:hypothetical protein